MCKLNWCGRWERRERLIFFFFFFCYLMCELTVLCGGYLCNGSPCLYQTSRVWVAVYVDVIAVQYGLHSLLHSWVRIKVAKDWRITWRNIIYRMEYVFDESSVQWMQDSVSKVTLESMTNWWKYHWFMNWSLSKQIIMNTLCGLCKSMWTVSDKKKKRSKAEWSIVQQLTYAQSVDILVTLLHCR